MKYSQHTTSTQARPSLREISGWYEHLRELHARLRPHFARPEVHQRAWRYLQAVLSDVPRKNGLHIAEQAREAHPYGVQLLLATALWDQDPVPDELPTLPHQPFPPPAPQQD